MSREKFRQELIAKIESEIDSAKHRLDAHEQGKKDLEDMKSLYTSTTMLSKVNDSILSYEKKISFEEGGIAKLSGILFDVKYFHNSEMFFVDTIVEE